MVGKGGSEPWLEAALSEQSTMSFLRRNVSLGWLKEQVRKGVAVAACGCPPHTLHVVAAGIISSWHRV